MIEKRARKYNATIPCITFFSFFFCSFFLNIIHISFQHEETRRNALPRKSRLFFFFSFSSSFVFSILSLSPLSVFCQEIFKTTIWVIGEKKKKRKEITKKGQYRSSTSIFFHNRPLIIYFAFDWPCVPPLSLLLYLYAFRSPSPYIFLSIFHFFFSIYLHVYSLKMVHIKHTTNARTHLHVSSFHVSILSFFFV